MDQWAVHLGVTELLSRVWLRRARWRDERRSRRRMKDGVKPPDAIQDVYLDKGVTVA